MAYTFIKRDEYIVRIRLTLQVSIIQVIYIKPLLKIIELISEISIHTHTLAY